jgi:hypothetical protein
MNIVKLARKNMNDLESIKEILSDMGIEEANYEVPGSLSTILVKANLPKQIAYKVTQKTLQSEFNRVSATIKDFYTEEEGQFRFAVFTVNCFDIMQ